MKTLSKKAGNKVMKPGWGENQMTKLERLTISLWAAAMLAIGIAGLVLEAGGAPWFYVGLIIACLLIMVLEIVNWRRSHRVFKTDDRPCCPYCKGSMGPSPDGVSGVLQCQKCGFRKILSKYDVEAETG